MKNYIGVTFGEKHSWFDYELKPVKFSTPLPAQRRKIQIVEGRPEPLDLSEALTGYMLYENRELEFVFDLRAHTQEEFDEKIFCIRNELDGIRMNIVIDTDSDFFYSGRVTVLGEYDPDDIEHEIVIQAIANPYKLRTEATVVSEAVKDEAFLVCHNLRKRVVPTIITDAEFLLEFQNGTYAVPAGENLVPEILLEPGENTITCRGTGNITFVYQEGAL